jgi:hypothetical protein
MIGFILGLVLGLVVTFIFERILFMNKVLKKNFIDNPRTFLGYHFYHSMYGIFFWCVGIFALVFGYANAMFYIGFGVGIIFMHTKTDKRFVFIEKGGK